jgi:tetratricopeptide (TPR) repeat protein
METTTSPRAHLDRGLRFEQAGTSDRALGAYREALAASFDHLEQAEARVRIARVLRTMARWDEAVAESRAAATAADRARADDLVAEAMNIELWVLHLRGASDEATSLGQQALSRAKAPRVRGITLQNLGIIAATRRDFVAADSYFAQSVEAFTQSGYELGTAIAMSNRAAAARDTGEPERALDLARDAAGLARRLNALDVLVGAVQNEAHALVLLGRMEEAEERLTEALGHFSAAGNPIRQAECLEIMGELCERRGESETARRCYSRARDIARTAGAETLTGRLDRRLTGEEALA